MSIKVEALTKIYKEQKAINNINLEINKGEIVGFIGPNGAGKSTTMKIICGLIPQTSGKVFINDKEIEEFRPEIKKLLGYLPENNPLYPEFFVTEFLEFIAGINQIPSIQSKVEEVIALTGLEKEKHKKIKELSKGYKQRVGLAQAIMHNPDILILDEPTTGLDPNQIIEIRNLISQMGKEKTVILSTHILQEVEAICDRVIIINNGEIVADDKPQTIKSNYVEKVLFVEFDNPVDIGQIKSISGVLDIINVKNNEYLIQSEINIDIRGEVFTYAVNNNLKVLTLNEQERKLEDVFHELTQK